MVVAHAGRQGPITGEGPLVLYVRKVKGPLFRRRKNVVWSEFDHLAQRHRNAAGRQCKVSTLTYILNSVLSCTRAGKNIMVGDTAIKGGQLSMHAVFSKTDFIEDPVGKRSTESAGRVDAGIVAVCVISPPPQVTAHVPVGGKIWSVIEYVDGVDFWREETAGV